MTSTLRRSALALGLALSVLAGCGDATGTSATNLASARQRWETSGVASYDFTISLLCECTTDALRPVVVVVANGVVQSRKFKDTGANLPSSRFSGYFTVEELFGIIGNARAANAARLDASYDATRGYPTSIAIDYNAMTADDEITYTITDFHVR